MHGLTEEVAGQFGRASELQPSVLALLQQLPDLRHCGRLASLEQASSMHGNVLTQKGHSKKACLSSHSGHDLFWVNPSLLSFLHGHGRASSATTDQCCSIPASENSLEECCAVPSWG